MIPTEEVYAIATLARLQLTPQEAELFARQLETILAYADQLNSIDTNGVEPTCLVAAAHDPLRDDTVIPPLSPHEALASGPAVQNGFFAVPRVIDQGRTGTNSPSAQS